MRSAESDAPLVDPASAGVLADETAGKRRGSRPEIPWMQQLGRLTFYNAKQRLPESLPVDPVPMETQVVRDAYITRRRIARTEGGDRFVSGAVYDSSGHILPGVMLDGPPREVIENPETVDLTRGAPTERLTGTWVYLGVLRPHFGHFLLESLSRAWYLVNLDPSVRILLHSDRETREFRSHVIAILNTLSIDPARVLIIEQDLRVEELIIPSPQFWLRRKASPGFCRVFDYMRDELVRRGNSGDNLPRKVYLTRRQYDPKFEHKLARSRVSEAKLRRLESKVRRSTTNEEEAEALFSSHGFQIIAPETLPFDQQIVLVGHATHVAGIAGSAMHMILANNNPDAKLIELSSRQIFNQMLIEGIRGVEAHHIHCAEESGDSGQFLLNIPLISRALDEIL